jgi:hypothetical protein
LQRVKEFFSRFATLLFFGIVPALVQGVELKQRRGGQMKIQNILRMQALVIGLAGVLFLASSAPAQEITNTEWPDAPGTTTTVQASPAPTVNNSNTAEVNPSSINAAASVAKPIANQEAAVSQWPAVETWTMACLLVFFTLIALYKRTAARHANSNLESRVRQLNDRVALS